MRSFDEWDHHPQGQAVAAQPLFTLERIGEADPRPLPKYGQDPRPLTDIRVLDLTRIIAGPVCGRALAAYGADVMLVNSPNLPNIDNIIDTSRGKLSVFADLDTADGRIALGNLLRSAHVFVQGYRPGAMAAQGFGPQDAARIRPGIVYVSLSAYGEHGPWARRRGFDSLVQTASGFNHAEAQAAGQPTPAAAHADPGPRFRLSDGLRRAGRAGASGHRGRQLACARVAGADRALAARPGSHRGRAGHAHAGHRCLPANGSVGLRRTGRLAPRRAVLADAGALDPAVLSAGHASHGLAWA